MSIPIPDPSDLQEALELSEEPPFVADGGFKAVFHSKVLSSQEEAIKAVYLPRAITHEDVLAREQLIARAKREIEALGECKHPNIVKLGSLPPQELSLTGNDYLVYSEEFLPGASLDKWVSSGKTPTYDELYAVFWALADLIEELDSLGYLHRDIKPANVIETSDPNRKFVVLDLGIAYKASGTDLSVGGAPGTLRYMAPEMLLPDYKDRIDFRSDLYSAALTVYVLATRVHPFGPSPAHRAHTHYRIMTMTPPPLHSLRPDLPEAFCKIIDRCVRKKPALRYGTIEALKKALNKVNP